RRRLEPRRTTARDPAHSRPCLASSGVRRPGARLHLHRRHLGISYRELDSPRGAFIVPTTTPTQFDPEQLIASIDRLLSYSPEAMYLMHFSRVTDVPRLGESLKGQIRELTRI